MGPEDRLVELGIELPAPQPAVGIYRAAERWGGLVFVSGHGPISVDATGRLPGRDSKDFTVEDALPHLMTGKVGAEVSVEEGREAARLTTLFLLAALRDAVGTLDAVHSIVKVFGMVNCAPGFTNTPAVIDGCSALLLDVFGEEVGGHARTAVGMAELPLNIPVEIEMVVGVAEAAGRALSP